MTATGHNATRIKPTMYGAEIYGSDDCRPAAIVYLDASGPDVVSQCGGEMPWEVWDAVVSVVAGYRAKMEA
jgi:hypothetical protein